MRDLKALLKETRPFEVEQPEKSLSLFLITLAVFALCLAGTGRVFPLPVRLVFSVLTGLVIVRIFIFYHDYLHGAIFRKSRWAGPVMGAYGVLILNPPNVWRRSHNYHHQHNSQMATASIGSFPLMSVRQYENAKPAKRALYRIARHPLTILFGYVTIFLLGMCLKSFLTDPRRHWDSLASLIVHGALMFGLSRIGWDVAVLSWGFPLFLACALGGYLFYIQHNFPDMKLKPREDWAFDYAALKSSSFMEASPLMHWFTGNIGYHHVHHLNHRIPFYRLPEAMEAIPELRNPGRTSLMPGEIVRCFRLKLWDPEQDAMVDFRRRPVSSSPPVSDPNISEPLPSH